MITTNDTNVYGLGIIKIGGSLITDKSRPFTLRDRNISTVVTEIAAIKQFQPDLRLIIINGNGSFGHTTAQKFGTHDGFADPRGRLGFCYLQKDTAKLNRLLVDRLLQANIPAISFPPGNIFWAEEKEYFYGNIEILEHYLARNFVPVLYGEAIIDLQLNGTTISSDVILQLLATYFAKHPQFAMHKLVNAGNYAGVLDDRGQVIPQITEENFAQVQEYLYETKGDISGGMAGKVRELSLKRLMRRASNTLPFTRFQLKIGTVLSRK